MNDYFSYNDGSHIVPSNTFRISPSQLSRFFDKTTNWYREFLLGEEGFQGNTATHLGTIVHAAAHMYHDNEEVDYDAIEEYIDNINDIEIDKDRIREQYPYMIDVLIRDHLAKTRRSEAELFSYQELLPGIGVGGSIDAYDSHRATIRDYKTMGSLDKARVPKSFPRAYWFQQLTYAWLLRKEGKKVNYIELVYITGNNTGRFNEKGKALKDYPSEVHTISMQVTDEDLDTIESCLMLIAESVKIWNEQPELRHILAQDRRLKLKEKPRLFK